MNFNFRKRQIPLIILILFGVLLLFMGIMNHYFFRTVTYDYGNYNFAFWDYSHFRISSIPTYPGTFFQDHLSFTLFFFIPVFWVLNWLTGTYTLIVIQYVLILIAAWYSYKIIRLKTNNTWLLSGVLLYYFLLLGRYTTFSCDVNLAVISACFIPVFLYYFEIKKYAVAAILLILSLLSRENIPIWFIFIFAFLIIQNRKNRKAVLFSLTGILVSVLYFILLFKVLIPAVESDEKQFTLFNYAALGANPGEALVFVLHYPIETIKMFFVNHLSDPGVDGVKAEFYWVYMISGGLVLFIRPQYFIWFIPIVAQKMLNDSYIRWGISTYYSIEVVTLLPLSVFLTLSSLRSVRFQKILTVLTCVATLSVTIYKLDRTNVEIPWTLNPSKEKFYYHGFYETDYQLAATHKLLKQIPKDAIISASDHVLPHLAQRQFIYLFPEVNDAEYIIFSVFDNYFMQSHMQNEKVRNLYMSDPEWEIMKDVFPVFLLKKKASISAMNHHLDHLTNHTDTMFCNYERVDSLETFALFGNGLPADDFFKIDTTTVRSGSRSLKLAPGQEYSRSLVLNDLDCLEYITVSVWFYGEGINLVASCGSSFYRLSNEVAETDTEGWSQVELSFWIPQKRRNKDLVIYAWNTNQEPVYLDDLRIVKRYKKAASKVSNF